jgi:hypothetical protein
MDSMDYERLKLTYLRILDRVSSKMWFYDHYLNLQILDKDNWGLFNKEKKLRIATAMSLNHQCNIRNIYNERSMVVNDIYLSIRRRLLKKKEKELSQLNAYNHNPNNINGYYNRQNAFGRLPNNIKKVPNPTIYQVLTNAIRFIWILLKTGLYGENNIQFKDKLKLLLSHKHAYSIYLKNFENIGKSAFETYHHIFLSSENFDEIMEKLGQGHIKGYWKHWKDHKMFVENIKLDVKNRDVVNFSTDYRNEDISELNVYNIISHYIGIPLIIGKVNKIRNKDKYTHVIMDKFIDMDTNLFSKIQDMECYRFIFRIHVLYWYGKLKDFSFDILFLLIFWINYILKILNGKNLTNKESRIKAIFSHDKKMGDVNLFMNTFENLKILNQKGLYKHLYDYLKIEKNLKYFPKKIIYDPRLKNMEIRKINDIRNFLNGQIYRQNNLNNLVFLIYLVYFGGYNIYDTNVHNLAENYMKKISPMGLNNTYRGRCINQIYLDLNKKIMIQNSKQQQQTHFNFNINMFGGGGGFLPQQQQQGQWGQQQRGQWGQPQQQQQGQWGQPPPKIIPHWKKKTIQSNEMDTSSDYFGKKSNIERNRIKDKRGMLNKIGFRIGRNNIANTPVMNHKNNIGQNILDAKTNYYINRVDIEMARKTLNGFIKKKNGIKSKIVEQQRIIKSSKQNLQQSLFDKEIRLERGKISKASKKMKSLIKDLIDYDDMIQDKVRKNGLNDEYGRELNDEFVFEMRFELKKSEVEREKQKGMSFKSEKDKNIESLKMEKQLLDQEVQLQRQLLENQRGFQVTGSNTNLVNEERMLKEEIQRKRQQIDEMRQGRIPIQGYETQPQQINIPIQGYETQPSPPQIVIQTEEEEQRQIQQILDKEIGTVSDEETGKKVVDYVPSDEEEETHSPQERRRSTRKRKKKKAAKVIQFSEEYESKHTEGIDEEEVPSEDERPTPDEERFLDERIEEQPETIVQPKPTPKTVIPSTEEDLVIKDINKYMIDNKLKSISKQQIRSVLMYVIVTNGRKLIKDKVIKLIEMVNKEKEESHKIKEKKIPEVINNIKVHIENYMKEKGIEDLDSEQIKGHILIDLDLNVTIDEFDQALSILKEEKNKPQTIVEKSTTVSEGDDDDDVDFSRVGADVVAAAAKGIGSGFRKIHLERVGDEAFNERVNQADYITGFYRDQRASKFQNVYTFFDEPEEEKDDPEYEEDIEFVPEDVDEDIPSDGTKVGKKRKRIEKEVPRKKIRTEEPVKQTNKIFEPLVFAKEVSIIKIFDELNKDNLVASEFKIDKIILERVFGSDKIDDNLYNKSIKLVNTHYKTHLKSSEKGYTWNLFKHVFLLILTLWNYILKTGVSQDAYFLFWKLIQLFRKYKETPFELKIHAKRMREQVDIAEREMNIHVILFKWFYDYFKEESIEDIIFQFDPFFLFDAELFESIKFYYDENRNKVRVMLTEEFTKLAKKYTNMTLGYESSSLTTIKLPYANRFTNLGIDNFNKMKKRIKKKHGKEFGGNWLLNNMYTACAMHKPEKFIDLHPFHYFLKPVDEHFKRVTYFQNDKDYMNRDYLMYILHSMNYLCWAFYISGINMMKEEVFTLVKVMREFFTLNYAQQFLSPQTIKLEDKIIKIKNYEIQLKEEEEDMFLNLAYITYLMSHYSNFEGDGVNILGNVYLSLENFKKKLKSKKKIIRYNGTYLNEHILGTIETDPLVSGEKTELSEQEVIDEILYEKGEKTAGIEGYESWWIDDKPIYETRDYKKMNEDLIPIREREHMEHQARYERMWAERERKRKEEEEKRKEEEEE